jgi:hypothetical protein
MSNDGRPELGLSNFINEAFDDEIVSHWVMIAEVINPEAQTLRVWTSEGSSRWMVRGMLGEAEEMLLGDEYEEQILDDMEDDE